MKPIEKKKRIKRSLNMIQKSAMLYTRRIDFAREDNASYQAAKKRSDYEEIVAHMDPPVTKAHSLAEIKEIANQYRKRSDFEKHNNSIYQAAIKRDDYEEIVAHMAPPLTEAYSLEEIQEKANKYQKRGDFKEGDSAVYNAAWKRSDFEQICAHMEQPINEAYTLKEIQEKANLCKSRGELYSKYPSIYQTAHKREDYEQIMAHTKRLSGPSKPELDLLDLIKIYWPKAQKINDRKVSILNKPHIRHFEIDIYVPELRKGVEFDDKYHHSFEGLKRGHPTWPEDDIEQYHEIKDAWFATKGILIHHIKEEDWKKDRDGCIKKCLEFLSFKS